MENTAASNCRNCGAPATRSEACAYCGTFTISIRSASAKPGEWQIGSATYNQNQLDAISESLGISPTILLGIALLTAMTFFHR